MIKYFDIFIYYVMVSCYVFIIFFIFQYFFVIIYYLIINLINLNKMLFYIDIFCSVVFSFGLLKFSIFMTFFKGLCAILLNHYRQVYLS
jgi:hypothetical protein